MKPSKEQFTERIKKIEALSAAVNDLQMLDVNFKAGVKSLDWKEIPDAAYDREFAKYQGLLAVVKAKAAAL